MHINLVEKIKAYDPNANEKIIIQAYFFSMQSHALQYRASGEPYFTHPVEVAFLLAEMKLDVASIITGLLHDTLEDTTVTLQEIHQLFGEEIAFLIDGVTKLTRIERQSDQVNQSDNFRKLFLAMASDIRVLLVKLADRLHNMRTLGHISSAEKRRKKALETIEIFVPLAERIGMEQMKNELEDLCFKELHFQARESVLQRLSVIKKTEENLIETIISELENYLKPSNIPLTISGREKTPYSIWFKMVKKNIEFDQLSDIIAFRIVVEDIEQVYQILGMIHKKYPCVPGRFKDYISTPKPNGYQSLHTTIIGPKQHQIEIQIRTQTMDYGAELGLAFHGEYKEGGALKDKKQYRWLRGILDILEHSSGPEEFLEHTKLEMFQDQVFCFSPKGDLIALPQGATPIDFAYAVHADIGDRCVSAKVNNQTIPLKTILKNGDQVEIITSITKNPLPIWENYVVTGKARARVRNYIRSGQHKQHIETGKSILQKVLQAQGYIFEENQFEKILNQLNLLHIEDLYVAISNGQLKVLDVIYNIYNQPFQKKLKNLEQTPSAMNFPIKGLVEGMTIHLEECCWPVPGDRIIGQVIPKKAVHVHTRNCAKIQKTITECSGWVDLSWTEFADSLGKYTVGIAITIKNTQGSLGKVTTEIGKYANINFIKMTNQSPYFFDFIVRIEVKDNIDLNHIMKALSALDNIKDVTRVKYQI